MPATMPPRVGVILSGCGFLDGAEITEAVSILIALDRRGAQTICFAPDIPHADAVNHLSKKPEPAPRNVLTESARIARGQIQSLAKANAADLDALILPGGFGAAKNLCTFASQGAEMTVNPLVERLLLDMVKSRKPIGLACIAPVIAAKVLGAAGLKPTVSIGRDPATATAIRAMHATHKDVGETDVCIDEPNRLVTTPCYMNSVGPWTVYQGAEKMVDEVLRMANNS
jgi:enhancing lycopene biosynthesis protein 2